MQQASATRFYNTAEEQTGSTAIPNGGGRGAVKGAEVEQDGQGEDDRVGQVGWDAEELAWRRCMKGLNRLRSVTSTVLR
jgi:hypothetical protein